ncbi:MAG: NADH-ubiquinone oxidoreductase-F iron-sulfur binding region domain-containing protein, partial [Acidimicrobiia bacterium]
MAADSSPSRVLRSSPRLTLGDALADGAGDALRAARSMTPAAVIDIVTASGLQGRGGAGFPAARKWQAVVANSTPGTPSTVVVNAAEGEPGSFKDRSIIRNDPYLMLEGALIAAHAVGADSVIVATKRAFTTESERLRAAVAEIQDAGWLGDVDVTVFDGPSEYLYGEETGLLEVIDGRPPFPRIAPPYRHGVEEIFDDPAEADAQIGTAAGVELAGPTAESVAPPTMASNVETLANVPGIVARGPEWFRELGTDSSPGTLVCTVTGSTNRHGVGEFSMGTPLGEIIETLGGGARAGHEIVAVMSGVANPLVPAGLLDLPVGYTEMREAGTGLGAAGFIVFDDSDDLVAVAAGVARFLAVESCGQCARCKQDGLALAERMASIARSEADDRTFSQVRSLLDTVADGARCNLATQQQVVIGSV